MEPRPSRRQISPRDRPGYSPADSPMRPPVGGAIGARPAPGFAGLPASAPPSDYYRPPGNPAGYGLDGIPEQFGQAFPLLPREVRHRRRVIRTVVTLLLVVGVTGGALALLLRDRFVGGLTQNPPAAEATVGGTTVAAAPPPVATTANGAQPEAAKSVLDNSPPTREPGPSAPIATEPDTTVAAPTRPSVETSDDPDPVGTGGESLLSLLPGAGDGPPGLVAQPPENWTREEVLSRLGDDPDMASSLDTWGWSGSVVAEFTEPPDAPVDPSLTNYLVVSVHQFQDGESASYALTQFGAIVIDAQGLDEESDVPPIGDDIRLLFGAPLGPTVVVAYVRVDSVLYRIGGSSPAGDPRADVLAMAELLVAKNPASAT